jgi:L-rhamnose mutarotase
MISAADLSVLSGPSIALQSSQCCGMGNFADRTSSQDSIFYDDSTGILFASFKYIGYDYEGDMEKMRENPKVREWWKMTDSYQESMVPGAVSSESGEPSWWKGLEQVFYFDGST